MLFAICCAQKNCNFPLILNNFLPTTASRIPAWTASEWVNMLKSLDKRSPWPFYMKPVAQEITHCDFERLDLVNKQCLVRCSPFQLPHFPTEYITTGWQGLSNCKGRPRVAASLLPWSPQELNDCRHEVNHVPSRAISINHRVGPKQNKLRLVTDGLLPTEVWVCRFEGLTWNRKLNWHLFIRSAP